MTLAVNKLPLFPLQTVLYPGGNLPLRIFEPRYVDLVSACMRADSQFGVVAIKSGREAGAAAIPHEVGTSASIIDWSQGQDGLLHIVASGHQRFHVESYETLPSQLLVAEVRWLDVVRQSEAPQELLKLKATLHKFLEKFDAIETFQPLADLPPDELVYRLADSLPLSLTRKLEILSCNELAARLILMTDSLMNYLQERPMS